MKRLLIVLSLVFVVVAAVPVRVVDVSANKAEINQQIAPKIQRMKQIADGRLEQWNALSYEQKRRLIQSGKYPLVNLMWNIYQYLHNNWFGEAVANGDI